MIRINNDECAGEKFFFLFFRSHAKESKMLHPGGGYKISFCNVNDNYVATAGRPGTTLKITHVKNKQSIVSANVEVSISL